MSYQAQPVPPDASPEAHRLLHVIEELIRSGSCYCYDLDIGQTECAFCRAEAVLDDYKFVGCESCPYAE